MGIYSSRDTEVIRAFARDVLSIEIEGPIRPQLTLVNIPSLIEVETKGLPRQILSLLTRSRIVTMLSLGRSSFAIISATSDYTTQRILTKIRAVLLYPEPGVMKPELGLSNGSGPLRVPSSAPK
jgi:hypothetical protein